MTSGYIHGYTDEEAARLLAQAPFLEQLVFGGLELSGVRTLLEVGVGVGAETQVVRARWPDTRIIGVDISEESLRRAHQTLSREIAAGHVQLVHSSGAKLPLADRSVDAALFIWVLEHVPDPLAVLRDTARCLRPGGRLIACEVYNNTLLIEPRCPIIDEYFSLLSEAQRRAGGHPNVGPRLPSLVAQVGLTVHALEPRHTLGDRRDRDACITLIRYFENICRSAEPQILEQQLMSADRIAEVWRAFDEVCVAPDALISYVAMRLEARK